MSFSLLCGPLCGIYDYNSQHLTSTIFAVFLQVREEPSSVLSREAGQSEIEAEPCTNTDVPLTEGSDTSLCARPQGRGNKAAFQPLLLHLHKPGIRGPSSASWQYRLHSSWPLQKSLAYLLLQQRQGEKPAHKDFIQQPRPWDGPGKMEPFSPLHGSLCWFPTKCFLSEIRSCVLKAAAPQTGLSWVGNKTIFLWKNTGDVIKAITTRLIVAR